MPTPRALTGALALLLWLASAPPSAGAEIDVTTGRDATLADLAEKDNTPCANDGDVCSLRAAVQRANELPGADVINLSGITYQLSLTGAGEDVALTGDLDVTSEIEIMAPTEGSFATTVIDGKKAKDRIFDVKPGGVLTLRRTTLQNGKTAKEDFDPGAPGEVSGGCLRSEGDVSLDAVFLFQCSSSDDGGCMSVIGGTAQLFGTIFSSCRAKNEGGGLELTALGSATLERTTLFGCKAATGGAIAASGPLELRNGTLDFNKAKVGGGLATLGSAATLINSSTLASNGSSNLDRLGSGTVTVSNSILAYAKTDCVGAITSAGGNLEEGDSCGFGEENDQQNQDPLLFPLSFNGAALGDPPDVPASPLVPVLSLHPDSPAIDHGLDASCETTDARGFPRDDVVDVGVAICDSGSFEFQQP